MLREKNSTGITVILPETKGPFRLIKNFSIERSVCVCVCNNPQAIRNYWSAGLSQQQLITRSFSLNDYLMRCTSGILMESISSNDEICEGKCDYGLEGYTVTLWGYFNSWLDQEYIAITVDSYVVEVPAYNKDRWGAICIEKGGRVDTDGAGEESAFILKHRHLFLHMKKVPPPTKRAS